MEIEEAKNERGGLRALAVDFLEPLPDVYCFRWFSYPVLDSFTLLLS